MKILGNCFGVDIEHEVYDGSKDEKHGHYVITMMVEDDGNWSKKNLIFDAAWLADILNVLGRAKNMMDNVDLHSTENQIDSDGLITGV